MVFNRDTLLRLIICAHFVLVSLVLLTAWLPWSYHFNQCVILALGFWAIVHRESVIQVELLMLIKFLSIILDAVAIGMYFQIGRQGDIEKSHFSYFTLSAFFAITLLVLKPIMLLLLNKVRQDRINDPSFGSWAPTSGYVSVDGR